MSMGGRERWVGGGAEAWRMSGGWMERRMVAGEHGKGG